MSTTTRMPSVFIGHGSPMNALPASAASNAYASALRRLAETLPHPKAILVVSAHWRTRGIQVLNVASPRTIHDFSGFPPALHAIQYAAPGAQDLSRRVLELLTEFDASETQDWGLDHGAWSVLRHMYPDADIPVTQLGIAKRTDLYNHLAIARKLAPLRAEGVLILGSGNLTHNLGEVDWNDDPRPMAWAEAFDSQIAKALSDLDTETLLGRGKIDSKLWRQAHPTLEHYTPLLYAYGSAQPGKYTGNIDFPYTEMQMGSISMRCVMCL